MQLQIEGSDLKAVQWDGYEVWVSPDLTLTVADGKGVVAGKIGVPRASVTVKELPKGAVARSDDVQVEGREDERALQLPLSGAVDVVLGEEVHVEALGLDTDVRGQVRMTLRQGIEPRFDGRLYLEDGRFTAYGQALTVDRGNLFFAGSIRNPVLDVQASRTINSTSGTVVAGVRVNGPAEDYRVDIYTEPSLPPTESLAYLVLGRPSFQASEADGQALSQTALALGLARSSPLTGQIASGLGLDELTLAGSDVAEAELIAGKQLNEDLYVRFSFGVFSELGALLLRYRLSQRLSLEIGSADVQSVDVLYSIEK
jgi:translocation and assembly module TamB